MRSRVSLSLFASGLSLLFALWGLVLLLTRPSPQYLWPEAKGLWVVWPYADSEHGGSSRIVRFDKQSRRLTVSFSMSDDLDSRYAGLSFSPISVPADLSRYDRLVMRYRTGEGSAFAFLAMIDLPGYSRSDESVSLLYAFAPIVPSEKMGRLVVKLKDFATPRWWFERNPRISPQQARVDFSRVTNIDITPTAAAKAEQSQSIEIESLRLESSLFWSIFPFFFLPIPFGLLFAAPRLRSRRKAEAGTPLVAPSWQNVEVTSRDDDDFQRLRELIGRTYVKPDLSLGFVCGELGIAEDRVSRVLEAKTGLRFKPYLNAVRIGEAKRLLVSSDKTVTEIADLVGYASLGHFNHVFKETVGSTPSDFRKGEGTRLEGNSG